MNLWHKLMVITLLAIGLRVGWGVMRYQADPLNVNLGDYDLYEDGAQHFLAEGDFSNSLFLVRPPLYPLMIAALGTDRLAVLIVGSVLGGLIAPLTYYLGRGFGLSENVSLGAALIYAVDYVAVVYGAALLDSVSLGNLFAILMMILLLAAVQAQDNRRSIWLGALAGLSLVVSALARPEIYLIWTGLIVWLWLMFRQRWAAFVTYALVSVIGLGAWAAHNGAVFGNTTVSTVSGFTMAFYRAASVERIGSGDDIETVYMNITRRVESHAGNDPDAATPDTRWGYHAAPPEIEDALVAVSIEIFREYPLVWLATFPVGFVRMYALEPPFLRGDPWWVYIGWAWSVALFLAATGGLIVSAIQRRWLFFWGTFLVAGYYTAGTLLVKNAGMIGRERAVLTSYMALATALLIATWWQRRTNSAL
jgi:hypothetical protein